MKLLDIHKKPVLTGLSAEYDWDAIEAWEDYVYCIAEGVSEETFDNLVSQVRALYDDYYRLHEG